MNQELYDKLMQELGASLAAMYQSKSEIDRLQGNWEAAEKEVQALKLENARLREALMVISQNRTDERQLYTLDCDCDDFARSALEAK